VANLVFVINLSFVTNLAFMAILAPVATLNSEEYPSVSLIDAATFFRGVKLEGSRDSRSTFKLTTSLED
jgi:hypothetical protein